MPSKKGAERLQKEIQEFIIKKEKSLENADAFKIQCDELDVSIEKAMAIRSEQVDRLLDDSPGLKSKGMVDRLLKSKLGESRQLEESRDKMHLGYLNSKRKAGQREVEIRKLTRDLDDLRFNGHAAAWAKGLDDFVAGVEQTERLLQNLKQLAAVASEDPGWFKRLPALGFDENYMLVGANYFTPGALNKMTSHSLIESLQRLSGKSLFKTTINTGNESSLSLEKGTTGRMFREHY